MNRSGRHEAPAPKAVRKPARRTWVKSVLMVLLLCVFLGFLISFLQVKGRYRKSREVYEDAASAYTSAVSQNEPAAAPANPTETDVSDVTAPDYSGVETFTNSTGDGPPIRVDFQELSRINKDIVGWIYCDDTVINYPVVYGRDNEYYLDRNYRGTYDPNGSIFADGANNRYITDSNILLYGHHMLDGSMFASLRNWFEQDYYEAHPVMWLLTPEQDYRVELFAGYTTTADSWTYTVYLAPSVQFDSYLQVAKNSSVFSSDVTLDSNAQYVVLSTCAYNGDEYGEFRTVLHGKLVPVDRANTA